MPLMPTQTLISEVLIGLGEPDGITPQGPLIPQPHWPRTNVLTKLNLAQDQIENEVPDLFQTVNKTLLTDGVSAGFVIPNNIGTILNLSLNGIPMQQTSLEALNSASLRGDIEENWQSTGISAGATDLYQWYTTVDDSIVSGTLQNMVYLYPIDLNVGDVITLEGEYLLAGLTDSATAYPFGDVAILTKAQKLLIKLATMDYAVISKPDLYERLYREVHGPDNQSGLLEDLRLAYNVLRTNPLPSIMTIQTSEDSASQSIVWRFEGGANGNTP